MELNAIEIVERIKSFLSAKDLEDIGIAQSTVSNWKIRNTIPKSEDLYKISQKIGVSMEYLLTGNDKTELSPDKIELLKNYDQLSDDMKAMINIQIAALAANIN